MSGFRVVVCGGGIAAVEGLLRLRRLAGDSVEICLLAPNDDLVMRPLRCASRSLPVLRAGTPFSGSPPTPTPSGGGTA